MTVGSILLGLALLALVALYVGRPLVEERRRRTGLVTTGERLATQKEALLVHIQALDFDFETGKIPEQDYRDQRAELVGEATAVLQQLDALPEVSLDDFPAHAAGRSTEDAEIEAAIARRRQRRSAGAVTATAAGNGTGNGRGRFCPACGKPTDLDDKFCAHCGQPLGQAQPT
jgi:hypothetical protein